jgi:hypothetical protein
MNTFTTHRLGVFAAAAIVASLAPVSAVAAPPSTEPPTPPIAVEELTRIDEDTVVRGNFTDSTGATLRFTPAGMDEVTIDLETLINVAVARITVQPGAQFPWHTHPGPVIVNVTHGELVYVRADDCVERPYRRDRRSSTPAAATSTPRSTRPTARPSSSPRSLK